MGRRLDPVKFGLRLREIDSTSPDERLHPEFDDALKTAMLAEPHLFFDELLKNDMPF